MADDVRAMVWSLDTEQAKAACESLIVLLDLHFDENNLKPQNNLDVSNLEELVSRGGDAPEKEFYSGLTSAGISEEEAGEAARSMLLLAVDLGFEEQVALACQGAQEHARDFGFVSGPLVLVGLAVVLAWVPKEQRVKVTKIHHKKPDGSEYTEDVTETEIIRVGAAAVEKLSEAVEWLSRWWKLRIGG